MTNYSHSKSLVAFAAGLFLIFSLAACETKKTPTETAKAFWSEIIENDVDSAKKYCSSQSQDLLPSINAQIEKAAFSYGKLVIDGNLASVETLLTLPTNKTSTFNTYLIKENDSWKIDCKRSSSELSGDHLFKEFFQDLNEFGENLNKQLEHQLPLIEKEIESFGQELKEQIDKFGSELKKSLPKKQPEPEPSPYQETI